MAGLARIGVAIEEDLLERFDAHIEARGYTNRSEAFRDLIRDRLIQDAVRQSNEPVVGTLTLIYDHHFRNLTDRLTDVQHDHHHHILATLHVHLDHDNCMEVLMLRGKADEVRRIADSIVATKGVKHGKLTVTTVGEATASGRRSGRGGSGASSTR